MIGLFFVALFLTGEFLVGETDSITSYQNALVAYKSADFKTAKTEVLKSIQLKPDDAHGKILLGKIELAQKNYTEAEKTLEPLLQKYPENSSLWIPWGDLLVFTGKPGKAIDFYEKAVLVESLKPDALLRKVYAYLKNKELGEAERVAAGLDGLNEKVPVFYFAKAAILVANGKQSESEIVLKNARTLYGDLVYLDYFRQYLWFFGKA